MNTEYTYQNKSTGGSYLNCRYGLGVRYFEEGGDKYIFHIGNASRLSPYITLFIMPTNNSKPVRVYRFCEEKDDKAKIKQTIQNIIQEICETNINFPL